MGEEIKPAMKSGIMNVFHLNIKRINSKALKTKFWKKREMKNKHICIYNSLI